MRLDQADAGHPAELAQIRLLEGLDEHTARSGVPAPPL
jgi:hypothetical protein